MKLIWLRKLQRASKWGYFESLILNIAFDFGSASVRAPESTFHPLGEKFDFVLRKLKKVLTRRIFESLVSNTAFNFWYSINNVILKINKWWRLHGRVRGQSSFPQISKLRKCSFPIVAKVFFIPLNMTTKIIVIVGSRVFCFCGVMSTSKICTTRPGTTPNQYWTWSSQNFHRHGTKNYRQLQENVGKLCKK